MKRRTVLHALLAALMLMLSAAPAMATATPTNVSVSYDHPERFTETTKLRALAPTLANDGYLKTLKTYIENRASAMLPPGEHLAIVITDIDRAGDFEPWLPYPMRDVRIIKDIYPPRIDLRFRLSDANGKVIREGTRKLRDPAFLYDNLATAGSDNLRYEKGLIDRWLRKGPDGL